MSEASAVVLGIWFVVFALLALISLACAGLCLKVYTEFVKERSMSSRVAKRDPDG